MYFFGGQLCTRLGLLDARASFSRPVESQLGPWGYKQHGSLCRNSSTGARGGYNKCKSIQNSYKTLVFHNAIFKLLHVIEIIDQALSIRTNLTSKEVLRELTNERLTNGFLNIICNSKSFTGPRVLPRLPPSRRYWSLES